MDDAAKHTVLRWFPYGLYAVTVMCEGEDHGMIANWVTQVSFEPPMVAVAFEHESRSLALIRDSRAFAVHVLGESQRDLAARLGRPSTHVPHKLVDVPSRPGSATGSPILHQSLGWLECRVVATLPTGDHTLVVGEVLEAGLGREGRALTLGETESKYAG